MATQEGVGEHLFISQETVSRLVRKGILPRAGRNEYDLDDCRRAYFDHLNRQIARRLGVPVHMAQDFYFWLRERNQWPPAREDLDDLRAQFFEEADDCLD